MVTLLEALLLDSGLARANDVGNIDFYSHNYDLKILIDLKFFIMLALLYFVTRYNRVVFIIG